MIGICLFLQLAIDTRPVVINPGPAEKSLPVVAAEAGAAVRADLLAAALGGSFTTGVNGHYSIVLPNARIDLIEGIPFARIDSVVIPLVFAPQVKEAQLLVPLQMVTDIVPRFGGGYFYDYALRQLRAFKTIVSHAPSTAPPPSAVIPSAVLPTGPPALTARPSRRLIVVDAGHGGPDRGMSGPIGDDPWFVEKDVTLSVARKLADALRSAGMDVLMTRTRDTLIALADRGRIANRAKGDVFVSIHVNAPGVSNAAGARERGFETYFLAEAKTEDARRVERMENESVRFETGANAPKGDPLSFIITDMAQNEHLRESSDLAATIQDGLSEIHPGRNRGVQQANFAVLRGSYMPAVLVEIGFGTNPSEAAYLADEDNQRRIARNLSESLMNYLARYDSRVGGTK